MALSSKVVSISTGTGAVGTTVVLTGLGFQPKVIIFWWNGRTGIADSIGMASHTRGFGWATSTTNRFAICGNSSDNVATSVTNRAQRNDCCVVTQDVGAAAIEGRLDLQSFDADGFTLVVDEVFSSSRVVHCYCLGGADLTNVLAGSRTIPTVTGNFATTGVGFQPDLLLIGSVNLTGTPPNTGGSLSLSFGMATAAAAQGVLSVQEQTAQATNGGRCYCNDVEILANINSVGTPVNGRTAFVSMDADGFTLNVVEAGTAINIFWLALKGGRYKVGSSATRTDSNAIAVTGVGVGVPVGLLIASHCEVESTTNTAQAHDRWTLGVSAGGGDRSAGILSKFGTDPMEVATAINFGEIYVNVGTLAALNGLMVRDSFDSDGFTVSMVDPDTQANFFLWMAAGSNAAATPVISSVGTPVPGGNFNVVGDGFEAAQGTGSVTIAGTAQTIVSWGNGLITVTGVIGSAKYGVNQTIRVTTNGALFDEDTVQWTPAAGTSFVNLVAPLASSGVRVTSTADIAGGDQIEINTVVGGTPADIIMQGNGSFKCLPAVTAFSFRVNDSVPSWGTSAVQTIGAGEIGVGFAFNLLRPMVRTLRAGANRRGTRVGWITVD